MTYSSADCLFHLAMTLNLLSCGSFFGKMMQLHNFNMISELPCPICGKLFHNKKYVDRHAKSAHVQQQDMRFNCDLCGKGFTDKKKLEQHTNVHLNLKPYKCRHGVYILQFSPYIWRKINNHCRPHQKMQWYILCLWKQNKVILYISNPSYFLYWVFFLNFYLDIFST